MRILVTGSREWQKLVDLWDQLDVISERAWREEADRLHEVVLVHGDCPTGADAIADTWARGHGIAVERMPADWITHGKAAGPIRNQEMVDAGPDVCLAFFKEGAANRGTADCVRRAEKAGIPVRKFYG